MKYFMHGFAQPLENWPSAHLLCVSLSLALSTFGLCTYWITQHLPNPILAHATLTELAQRTTSAQKIAANLPTLKQHTETLQAQHRKAQQILEEANLFHHIEHEASANALQLESFEPQPIITDVHHTERVVRIRVSGTYSNITRYAQQLAHSALLISSLEAQLSAQQDLILLECTLRIAGLPPPKPPFSSHRNPLNSNKDQDAYISPVRHRKMASHTRFYDPFHNYADTLLKQLPNLHNIQPTLLPLKLLGLFTQYTQGTLRQAAWIQAPNTAALVYRGDCIESQRHGNEHAFTLSFIHRHTCSKHIKTRRASQHNSKHKLLHKNEITTFQETVLSIDSRSVSLIGPNGVRVLSLEEPKS